VFHVECRGMYKRRVFFQAALIVMFVKLLKGNGEHVDEEDILL